MHRWFFSNLKRATFYDRAHPRGHAAQDDLRHIRERTRSVLGGVTTLERGNDHGPQAHWSCPSLRVGMPPVTLRVTNGTDCGFSEPSAWLKAPFRPSATYFDGAKYANPCAPVPAPASPGFLRPDTDSGVAALGHPWPSAAQSASMPIAPRISARTQPSPTSRSAVFMPSCYKSTPVPLRLRVAN